MKYLVIQLCDHSPSFCHYSVDAAGSENLISLGDLQRGLLWGIKERLEIQVVYPNYQLPQEYYNLLKFTEHTGISSPKIVPKDILILSESDLKSQTDYFDLPVILHMKISDFIQTSESIAEKLENFVRLNVIFTDIEDFRDLDISRYDQALRLLANRLVTLYKEGRMVQFNLLTDRLMLTKMNNCGAGHDSITLAPDGQFYICPGFYYEGYEAIGSLDEGLKISNKNLYKLNYAPICRECDAFHCHRCVFLNKKLTLEVNTPSHQQCTLSHVERKVSLELLRALRKYGEFTPQVIIPDIDYIDPIEKIINKGK